MRIDRILTFSLALAAIATAPVRAQVGVNATGAAPNPRAMMDVAHASKGLLIPRVTEAQRLALPLVNSMMVYQTAAGAIPVSSPEGYWYYDATIPKWVPLSTAVNGWDIYGNTGTNVATDYIGTSDAQDFGIRTNNVERIRINSAGRVQLPPTVAANEALNVNGAILQNDSSLNPPLKGNIAYWPAYKAHMGNVDGTANGWYQLENVFTKRVNQQYDSMPPPGSCSVPATLPQVGTFNFIMFGTIETPYSTFWEDGRHQYLYSAADLAALNLCPNTCWTGIGFRALNAGLQVNAPEIRMKNETATALPSFILTGLNLLYTAPTYNPAVGPNMHMFNQGGNCFQWDGTSNVLVEFCFNNYQWAGSSGVEAFTTPGIQSLHGSYCDACGGTGTIPCVPTIPPNPGCPGVAGTGPFPGNGWTGMGVGPCGPGCNAVCSGYSMTPGCMHFDGMNLVTCDGTFTWVGAQGSFQRTPVLIINGQTGTVVVPCFSTLTSDYIHSTLPVMVGSPAWAATGPSPYMMKGPGTLSAQVAVWGQNVMLSDYVFDKYFDGSVRAEDGHGRTFRHTPVNELVNYVERERRLPTIDGRERWNDAGAPSMDHLTTQLWVTVEEQALYIKELNERMEALQKLLVEKRLRSLGN